MFFLHQKEAPTDVENQSYREDEGQLQEKLCQKGQVLESAAAEKDGLGSNPPVPAHEVTHSLLFQVKSVSCSIFVSTWPSAEVVLKEETITHFKIKVIAYSSYGHYSFELHPKCLPHHNNGSVQKRVHPSFESHHNQSL